MADSTCSCPTCEENRELRTVLGGLSLVFTEALTTNTNEAPYLVFTVDFIRRTRDMIAMVLLVD